MIIFKKNIFLKYSLDKAKFAYLKLFLLGFLFILTNTFATTNVANNLSETPSNTNSTSVNAKGTSQQMVNLKEKLYYCPSVSELVKSNLRWSAREGNWKSFSQSASTEVDYFLGAEWKGVNIGKIMCLYQGKGSFDFPIVLEPTKSTPILEPTFLAWIKSQSGSKLCKSVNIADCPFSVSKEENNTDIYEQIKYKETRN